MSDSNIIQGVVEGSFVNYSVTLSSSSLPSFLCTRDAYEQISLLKFSPIYCEREQPSIHANEVLLSM